MNTSGTIFLQIPSTQSPNPPAIQSNDSTLSEDSYRPAQRNGHNPPSDPRPHNQGPSFGNAPSSPGTRSGPIAASTSTRGNAATYYRTNSRPSPHYNSRGFDSLAEPRASVPRGPRHDPRSSPYKNVRNYTSSPSRGAPSARVNVIDLTRNSSDHYSLNISTAPV
jgi:hypothetical protein